jgi:hypothetical protein
LTNYQGGATVKKAVFILILLLIAFTGSAQSQSYFGGYVAADLAASISDIFIDCGVFGYYQIGLFTVGAGFKSYILHLYNTSSRAGSRDMFGMFYGAVGIFGFYVGVGGYLLFYDDSSNGTYPGVFNAPFITIGIVPNVLSIPLGPGRLGIDGSMDAFFSGGGSPASFEDYLLGIVGFMKFSSGIRYSISFE